MATNGSGPMAIDFMIMPISRYIAGDFVTPTMRFCWEQGTPYFVIGPDGKREIPPNVPYGGEVARQKRLQIVGMVLEDLRGLPIKDAASIWDEHSEAEPRFHRVDPESYNALCQQPKPGAFRRIISLGKIGGAPHCASSLFLPLTFSSPFPIVEPLERTCGSTPVALKELASAAFMPAAANAAATLREALQDSMTLQMPMIVDW